MLLHSLKLQNLLSFGPDSPEVPLGPLNVIIGPNGSGKSNFIEAISLLQSMPKSFKEGIRKMDPVTDLIWKRKVPAWEARIEAIINDPIFVSDYDPVEFEKNTAPQIPIRYTLSFAVISQGLAITSEKIEKAKAINNNESPELFFERNDQGAFILARENEIVTTPGSPQIILVPKGQLRPVSIDQSQSVLSQRKDPDRFTELFYLGEDFSKIKFFKNWSFGRDAEIRQPQPADTRNDFLEENGLNLGLVLNRIRREPKAKKQLLDGLKALYAGIDDFDVTVEGGTVQVFLQEGDITIPATRLSDGTLRYLCLLAILCHPSPPPLICIEEPELGLHPDLMPKLADLMRDASERTQIIATTHSDILVDALTETPDSILVCEKHDGSTTLKRLNPEDLKVWLEKYSLGELWRSGQIGGNRW